MHLLLWLTVVTAALAYHPPRYPTVSESRLSLLEISAMSIARCSRSIVCQDLTLHP